MENTEKLTNSKEVIAYIAERFPLCFTLEGEAKPLKIGIFEDLATNLTGDPKVSKTQLRAALRQYTSSWRYLYGVKAGAVRVDLDGNACGEIEAEHVEHAQKALEESKAKVAERRKEQAVKRAAERKAQAPKGKKERKDAPKNKNRSADASKLKKTEEQPTRALTPEEIRVNNTVKVSMGQGAIAATIVEINKEDVRVRLTNGLTLVVKAEHLRA
jgi:ProP effector